MLARAFAGDPTTAWLFPSPSGRERRLERWYRLNVMALQDAGEGWVTDDLSAAALWLPMGVPRRGGRPHLWRQLGLNLRIGLTLRTRLLVALSVNLEVHRCHPHEPTWYLAALGTEPDLQGRGLGTAVLQPVLRRCDSELLPATLDTVTAEDVAFYQRRGFEIVSEVQRPGAPHFRIMRRPPGSAPGPNRPGS